MEQDVFLLSRGFHDSKELLGRVPVRQAEELLVFIVLVSHFRVHLDFEGEVVIFVDNVLDVTQHDGIFLMPSVTRALGRTQEGLPGKIKV